MSAAPESRAVWYVQPYAGGPGIGRQYRGHTFSQEWAKSGIKTHIFCGANHHLLNHPRTPDSFEQVDDCHYHFLKLPDYSDNGIGRLWNMMQFGSSFSRYVRRSSIERPSAIIYSSPHPFGAASALRLAKSYGVPFVLEVRDLWPDSLTALTSIGKWHPVVHYLRHMERRLYTTADAVVSLLPCTEEHMISRGLRPGHWHYIPNGAAYVETDTNAETSDLRRWIVDKQQHGKRVLVYAGALGLPNAVHRLIDAADALPGAIRDRLQILIVGRGSEEQALEQRARKVSLHIHPQIERSELMQLLPLCDGGFISLAPSALFNHGVSPNKMFDYMMSALPVISAINAGNDPVTEANCGWSVVSENTEDLTDAIGKFATVDQTALTAMGSSGATWVAKHHSYKELGGRYLKLIDSLRST